MKTCQEKEKPAFSPFPTIVSTIPKTNINFLVTFILSSASALNLGNSKILWFGKELIYCFQNCSAGNELFLTLSQTSSGFDMSAVSVF